MTEDRFEELLGPFLLADLSVEEERELERHLEGCSGCRGELARARQTHGLLRELAAGGPPPALKDRVLARARGEIPARSRVGWRLWVPAAALLTIAVLGAGLLWAFTQESSEGIPLTATVAASHGGGEVSGEVDRGNLQIELVVWDLPELRKDEYYELWYAKEDGGRISCGTFRAQPGGQTTVNLTAPVGATSYPKIEVTREPDDGDPGSSGEKVLVGDLRSL
ncbi:MAG: anti-sigma factor [Actinomycetota bacterium]|nr:anti-sigma factor [Actinomycetota bacterium]